MGSAINKSNPLLRALCPPHSQSGHKNNSPDSYDTPAPTPTTSVAVGLKKRYIKQSDSSRTPLEVTLRKRCLLLRGKSRLTGREQLGTP